jgi:polyphenol oxidase
MKAEFQNIHYGFSVEPKGATVGAFHQVHGKNILEIKDTPHWEGLKTLRPEADGAFTFSKNLELSVFTADCLPLLFFAEDSSLLGALHSGWRGTMQGIARSFTEKFSDLSLHAVLGPCLLPCCFEVKEDFIETFSSIDPKVEQYIDRRSQKTYFDLPLYVQKEQLSSIPECRRHLQFLRCTLCSSPALPSYRRQKGTDPRIRGWIRHAPSS